MLSLAHAGLPPEPHDLWLSWNLSPPLLIALVTSSWLFLRGRGTSPAASHADARRARFFAGALAAIAFALVSPLDPLSESLASAHMVQHVLLILIAPPLLVLSAPSTTLLRGTPMLLRRRLGRLRGRVSSAWRDLGGVGNAVVLWILHTCTLWFWHAAVPYEAAIDNEIVHLLEHASFLITALLFWHVVLGLRTSDGVHFGLGASLVFGMALQSGFLSLLLTFSQTPWYPSYATSTQAWGLQPLTDQQLAGVIMWIPAGLTYLGVALALFVAWVKASEHGDIAAVRRDDSSTST